MSKDVKWKYAANRFGLIRQKAMTTFQNESIRAAGKAKTKEKRGAPKLTGALRSSIYVFSPKGSGYDEAIALARSLNPQQKPEQELPPVTLPPIGRHERIAGIDCPLDYGAIIENGGFNPVTDSYIGARPFFAPALDAAFPDFIKDLEKDLETL